MGGTISTLWKTPEVNPVTQKARSIPAFNVLNTHGRVFFLSWWGFFVAFWSWYAFPPLIYHTIKADLDLSHADIANSHILSLVATLVVRLIAGPACDRFGPRWTFAGILLAGAIPTALAGTVNTPAGLIVIRFFVGILGGSFIPCQVWTTGFFDKNIVGTANSLAAGFGNAGGGVAYFVMPAVYDSLVQNQNLTPHAAWRVAFVVPFILITATALVMVITCPDTPTGKWSSRARDTKQALDMRETFFSTIGNRKDKKMTPPSLESAGFSNDTIGLKTARNETTEGNYSEMQAHEDDILTAASWELVEKPTIQGTVKAISSLPTLTLSVAYFCSFGAELAIYSILGAYYSENLHLGQTASGNWAAMFGFLNILFRPAGGILCDTIYRFTRSLWAKKIVVHTLGALMGAFMMLIGFMDPGKKAVMVGLMTGLAFFGEAANGACFALVPHVHPTANGIITGLTGAAGDLGGIIFLLAARYNGTDYGKVYWIIGAIAIAGNVLVSWIRPIPKGQLGGR